MLVALPSVDLDALQTAIDEQLATLPRAAMAKKSLENSKIIQVQDRAEALDFSNAYAPEHLIINTQDADSYVPGIMNAGSVFLGRYTPESVGDYASGRTVRMTKAFSYSCCCSRHKSRLANLWMRADVQWGLSGFVPEEDHCAEAQSNRTGGFGSHCGEDGCDRDIGSS